MKREVISMVAVCGFLAAPVSAGISVTLNPTTGNTDVAAGILTLDELQTPDNWAATPISYTYANVGGGGFDIKVSSTAGLVNSTGNLNYTKPNYGIAFEFFTTGTTSPVAVSGFALDWRDLDSGNTAGPFQIVDAWGNTQILATNNSSYFTLGSAISTTDLVAGNGVSPDGLRSSASGDWDLVSTHFELTTLPILSFTLVGSTDWIAPTGTMTLTVVPLPASILLGVFAVGLAGRKLRAFV